MLCDLLATKCEWSWSCYQCKNWGYGEMWPLWENFGFSFFLQLDLSPGDHGRRPLLIASAALPHYKLESRRQHCSARSFLPNSSAEQSLTYNVSKCFVCFVAPVSSAQEFLKAARCWYLMWLLWAFPSPYTFPHFWYSRLEMEKGELLCVCRRSCFILGINAHV